MKYTSSCTHTREIEALLLSPDSEPGIPLAGGTYSSAERAFAFHLKGELFLSVASTFGKSAGSLLRVMVLTLQDSGCSGKL